MITHTVMKLLKPPFTTYDCDKWISLTSDYFIEKQVIVLWCDKNLSHRWSKRMFFYTSR